MYTPVPMRTSSARSISRGVLLAAMGWLGAACGGAAATEVAPVVATEQPLDEAAVRTFQRGVTALGNPRGRDEARAAFEAALAREPRLWEARFNLAILARRAGELEQAERELTTVYEAERDQREVVLALAEVRHARGRSDESLSVLETFVRAHPDDVPVRVALAEVLRGRGRFDDALTAARDALVRNPREVGALMEVGRIYRARGDHEVAELVFRKALELGDSAAVHNDLGLLEAERGDTQAAFGEFERAIALDASFVAAHRNQGSLFLHAGDYESAARSYRAVLEREEGDLDARVALGVALRGQGQHREAARELESVLERAPSYGPALYDLGILRAEFLDDRANARPLFERFLTVWSTNGPERTEAERYVRDLAPPSAAPPSAAPAPTVNAE